MRLWAEYNLLQNVFQSWWRIAQAFLWCAVIAIPLGLLMGSFRWVHHLVNPVAAPMRSMPITAFLPAFIALFGIAVMDGIIVLSQYNNLIDSGLERTAAALRTGALQMRPVLMTCIIAGVGLFPAALSTGIGSQVQKPLAVVVVGGMVLAPILILVILPALILIFSRRSSRLEPA